MAHKFNSSLFVRDEKTDNFLEGLNSVEAGISDVLQTDKGFNSGVNSLNNFNIFGVMTPQINYNIIPINEGLLIDIGNDEKSIEKKSKHKECFDTNILKGSIADVKKNEFNLIDLYENIFVTPQHVTKEQPCTNTTNSLKEINDLFFFNDAVVNNDRSDVQNEINDHENSLENALTSKQYDEIFDKVVSSKNMSIYNDKQFSAVQNKSLMSNHSRFNTLNDSRNNKSEDIDDIIQDILHMNIEQNQMMKKSKETRAIDISNVAVVATKDYQIDEPSTTTTNNSEKYSLPDNRTDIYVITSENPKILNGVSSTLCKVKMLDTVKKDEKSAKSKTEPSQFVDETNLTRGPDLFEKSVVMPQIMQRIAERNNRLAEEHNLNLQRKLLLDSGNVDYNQVDMLDVKPKRRIKKNPRKIREEINTLHSSSTMKESPLDKNMTTITTGGVTLNPIVLMEDSKKVRLEALELRRKFESFVLGNKRDN